MIPRLKDQYEKIIVDNLKKKFSIKNKLMIPKVSKIILNMGLGADGVDKKKVQMCIDDMSLISGQRPVVTKFRQSISNFKTRKGTSAGVKVTIRRKKMYEFLDRLVTSALPRVRDFQGIKASGFDGRGNYNLGVREQIIFPEIDIDKVNKISGMDITFVTSANTDKEAKSLLTELGLPFKKN